MEIKYIRRNKKGDMEIFTNNIISCNKASK